MGLMRRLYRGETKFNFIGSRKRWYIASAIIIAIMVLFMLIRGFNWGIDFAGGTQFVFNKPDKVSLEQAEKIVKDTGTQVQTVQQAGSGDRAKYVIKTGTLSQSKKDDVKKALATETKTPEGQITVNSVSSTWGKQVTRQALLALVVFLVLVSIYIAIRYERAMAAAAIGALLHDLVLTAGAYAIIGFEVTPSTVVGLLTILGFSLYDTVVVFDKVQENTKGISSGSAVTYGEAANLAVNQTLMRSINTSIISLLPVAGLLFVGAGLLGVGTLKDLALVLFVGLAAGTYSSLFLATPWLVDLKERQPKFKALRQRVLAKRAAEHTTIDDVVPAGDGYDDDEDDDDLVAAGDRRKGKHGRVTSRKRGR